MQIDLTELGLAYRRAKADLYYTKNANSAKLLRFEKNLVANLTHVYELLSEERFAELLSSYCYGYRLIPKSIKFTDEESSQSKTTVIVGDDFRAVEQCDLRLIEDLPIEFHIVTQLWIDRVAGRFDYAMSEMSYGYRLRRHREKINRFYPGSFKYWMRQYQDWHNGGLETISKALDEGKNVAVLTTDFSAFYHNLSPSFILRREFLKKLGVSLRSRDDKILTELVVNMLNKWAASTPLGCGLPVGCSISSVFANLALTLLDRELEQLSGRVYYGRYVDDVILAIENGNGIQSQDDFIDWICSQVGDMVKEVDSINYSPGWLTLEKGCKLSFQKTKTKVFLFNGKDGKDFVVSLQTQIHKRTSEWRALPELPDDPLKLVKSIMAITDHQGIEVDKLRQAEEASIRRAAFAMKLSDFSDYALCLDASDWVDQRHAFVEAVKIYFTTVKNYFELNRYFPRLLALALHGLTKSNEKSLSAVQGMLQRVASAIDKAFEGKKVTVSSHEISELKEVIDPKAALTYQVAREFAEAVVSAVPDNDVRGMVLKYIQETFPSAAGITEALPSYDEMLLSDLAQKPYKALLFSALDARFQECKYDVHPIHGLDNIIPKDMYMNTKKFLMVRREWEQNLFDKEAFAGLVFPVRKMSTIELFSIFPRPYSNSPGEWNIIAEYLRLISYSNVKGSEIFPTNGRDTRFICVEDEKINEKEGARSKEDGASQGYVKGRRDTFNVALAYWRMDNDDWTYQVNGKASPKRAKRFKRLMGLVNSMFRSGCWKGKIDYILFPELAMPWQWYLLLQKKIKVHGASLISGVEYIRSLRENKVRHEVWCALKYCGMGFPDSLLVRISKTAPACEERQELLKHKLDLDCQTLNNTFRAGTVIQHGHQKRWLFFSVLICSDLTDINLRSQLRGHVDMLCVPAWNQDMKTFNALVTSSAHDLHAYVALCNNGEYGDTRIRAPLVEDYARDIVQLKGGDNDYWVVASVNANAIRRFHADCSAACDPKYKPIPIGFRMSRERENVVDKLPVNVAGKSFLHVKIGNSYLKLQLPKGKGGHLSERISFRSINTKAKVLQKVAELLSTKGVTLGLVTEFLQACKICVGVDVGEVSG